MFKRVGDNGIKCICLLVLAMFIYSTTAQARVCFLPGGKCPGQPLAKTLKGIQGDQCLGYNLTQKKCEGQACEEGWICESCTNAQGTFYKCTPKPTPPDFTPGLEKCPSPCQKYTWNGFTGNQINGKCEGINDYTPTKPNPCRSYITPDYTCGVSISGADVNYLTKENGGCQVCYTNIFEMIGYTTSKPASCTTYNSKRNGLGTNQDTMCYTSGTSIGEYFSTAERDSEVFTIETKYGVDTFISLSGAQTKKNTEACYKATGCNTANGWLKAGEVDGSKFEYLEKSSDGIVCRKAIACKESNNWFNYEKLGQYNNKYFTMEEETRSGLTCYKVKGCHTNAYTSQPDGRFFTFDKKTSNGHNCWTVTGKADYAYSTNDKKTNMFDYTGATAYLNGTTTEVTYWIVNKDNGRNGCMQYAYESQPDTRYFASSSAAQYVNGSSTTKTCWNITGKADYAYDAGDKKTNFFDYTSATGYLNGTSTQVTYWIVNKDNGRNGCMQYAYESQPDAKYFASASETHYSNGSSTTKTCWNITGKGTYAYTESDKLTHFAYDSGQSGYLNGTSTTVKYYNVTSCGTYAYPTQPDAKYFSFEMKEQYKGGENNVLKCWNVTGKGAYAYTAEEKQTAYFAYDSGSTAYLNGTSTTGTYYNVTGCASGASNSPQDTSIYEIDYKTQYKGGANDSLKCYRPLKCNVGYKQVSASNAYGFICTACPEGTYNDTAGSKSCTNCKAGTYNNSTAQTSSSACKLCEAGTYSKAGSASCTPCAAETYALAGSESCSACQNKPALSESCGCSGNHTRTATCDAKTGVWSTSNWTNCAGESDYYVKAESSSSGCSCGATKSRSYYCLSGWGSWGSCTGADYNQCTSSSETESDSTSCGCGGTKSRSRTITTKSGSCCSSAGTTYSDWSSWSECSKSDCASGQTCVSGSCKNNSYTDGSQDCGCGGTKTKTCTLNGSGTYDCSWSECSKSDCSNGETCCKGKCVSYGATTYSYDKSTCSKTTKNCMLNNTTCEYTEMCSTYTSATCKSGETCDGNGNCKTASCGVRPELHAPNNCTGYKDRECTCTSTGQWECTDWVVRVEGRLCTGDEQCLATLVTEYGPFSENCKARGKIMRFTGAGHMQDCFWCE